jgi:hypothetical protein
VREQLVDHHNHHDRARDACDHGRRARADHDRARDHVDYARADCARADCARDHGDHGRRARADYALLSSWCEFVVCPRFRPRLSAIDHGQSGALFCDHRLA